MKIFSLPAIHFTVVELNEPHQVKLKMNGHPKNFMTGIYQADLSELNGITTVTAYEKVTHLSFFTRVFSNLFFDLEAFAIGYLRELEEKINTINN